MHLYVSNISIRVLIRQEKYPHWFVIFSPPLRLKDTHKTTSVGTRSSYWQSGPTHLHGEYVGDFCLCHEGIKEGLQRT